MAIKNAFFRLILKISKNSYKTLIYLLKKLSFFKDLTALLSKAVFHLFIFPAYKSLHFIRYKLVRVYSPTKSRVFYFLNKSYFIHALVIVIGFFVVINNINAQELRPETYGEQTLVYSIVSKEVYEELSVETKLVAQPTDTISYLDLTGSVGVQHNMIDSAADNFQKDLAYDAGLTATTEGGAAIVKPNILNSIDVSEVPQQENRNTIIKYVVQGGETISSIANKFGISSETILWENGLSPKSLIRPGDSLDILPVTGVAHVVSKGENLGYIAKKYGVDVDKIVQANNLFDVSDISINQKLIIPDGKKITTYVATANTSSSGTTAVKQLFKPSEEAIAASGFLWPTSVRRITQYYSWTHTGLDIAGPIGTPLYASDAGKVIYAGWSTGYGYNVLIDHENGYKTRYAHSSKLHVSVGDRVVKGQTIADMGSTGWSTGPHIHFEVIYNGVKKNPLSYIK